MSAGVSDQRMKGQGNTVSNGPKEQLGVGEGAGAEEYEPWRTQQPNSAAHSGYSASVPISSATDLYNMNTAGFYGSGGTYPYQAFGVGDGTWSNGSDAAVTFLGGYHHDSYSMDGMFGPPSAATTFSTPTAFGQPSASFNYFHTNGGDYNTWGTQQIGDQQRKYDYYRDPASMYAATTNMPETMKSVEQAMQNLDLKSSVESSKESQAKKATWASIASQPAKPQINVQSQGPKKKGPGMPPGPIIPGKHNMDIGTWDTNKPTPPQIPVVNTTVPKPMTPSMPVRPGWNAPLPGNSNNYRGPAAPRPGPQPHPMQSYQAPMIPPHMPQTVNMQAPSSGGHVPMHHMQQTAVTQQQQIPPQHQIQVQQQQPQHHHQMQQQQSPPQQQPPVLSSPTIATHPVLDELRVKNNYNPQDFDLSAPNARFFVIKSYSEDDIHRSIKYEIWCSTEHGNKRLDLAYREREPSGCVYLFFSVNGSGHFCGMAQMVSAVDYNSNSSVWSQDKWKGQFKVRWIYVKDVPNVQLRHIKLENNENKPVTNSRDTQEVPHARGLQVLRIMHTFKHSTSIFDDFIHYEKRQEEEDSRKQPESNQSGPAGGNHHHGGGSKNAYHGGHDRDRGDHGGHREHHRDHRDRGGDHRGGHRNHDRDRDHRGGDRDNERDHRSSGHYRNQDHERGGGDRDRHHDRDRGHHKERGDRGRGSRGRDNRN